MKIKYIDNHKLYDYQRRTIKWMTDLEKKKVRSNRCHSRKKINESGNGTTFITTQTKCVVNSYNIIVI